MHHFLRDSWGDERGEYLGEFSPRPPYIVFVTYSSRFADVENEMRPSLYLR